MESIQQAAKRAEAEMRSADGNNKPCKEPVKLALQVE
jgi:hypothetical protein